MDILDKSDEIFLSKLCGGESPGSYARWQSVLETVVAAEKAELHCHLAGSMRPETLKHLAQSIRNLDWGFSSEGFGHSIAQRIKEGSIDEIKQYLEYRKNRGSLADYMVAYSLPKTVLATDEALRRVAYEVCEDNYHEGVRYLEIRFNPWMLTGRIKIKKYVSAIARGANEASGNYPDLEIALLLSLVKDYDPELAAMILDESLECNTDPVVGGRIKGVDSAGNEIGFRPARYADIFSRAREAGLAVVCHAGEAFEALENGITVINEAIDLLGAKRIGHGLAAGIDPTMLLGSNDLNGNLYDEKRVERIVESQRKLRQRLRAEGILIEVCPSSNIHTGNIRSIDKHPVKLFLSEGVPFSICTDNRWISHTKLSWEYVRLVKVLNLDMETIRRLIELPFRYKLENLEGK